MSFLVLLEIVAMIRDIRNVYMNKARNLLKREHLNMRFKVAIKEVFMRVKCDQASTLLIYL